MLLVQSVSAKAGEGVVGGRRSRSIPTAGGRSGRLSVTAGMSGGMSVRAGGFAAADAYRV
jgi:hypothetical protein